MQPIWPLAAALARLQAACLEVPSPVAVPSPHARRGLESVLLGVPCPEVGFLCAEPPPTSSFLDVTAPRASPGGCLGNS